jgi:spermidine synthase
MRKIIAALFFLSGITGLIYQLLWVRKFTYLLGSAYLTVSIVIASFMAGLLVGAWLAGRFMDRAKNPVRWYGILEILIGIYAFLFILLFNFFNTLFGSIYMVFENSDTWRIAFTALLILCLFSTFQKSFPTSK